MLSRPFIDIVAPDDLGVQLALDPTDPFQLEIWTGAYQPHVIHFLRACVQSGDRVLCAGLHIGYVASLARRLAGPNGVVVSAEPDPAARKAADTSLLLANPMLDAPIHILEGGLSRESGTIRLYESAVLGHSSFSSPHQPKSEHQVSIRRGDEWLQTLGINSLQVMVLDVEGWELHALQGLRTIVQHSPGMRVLFEVSDYALKDAGTSRSELFAFWTDLGFELRWAASYGSGYKMGVWGDLAVTDDSPKSIDVLAFRPTEKA